MVAVLQGGSNPPATDMSYNTREEWLTEAMREMAPWFEEVSFHFPENVKVSCGWPSKSALAAKKRRIGEAWASQCSAIKYFELFISPYLAKPIEVLATLIHEQVHAAVGLECGHKGDFKKCAKALGLEGKMTATVPGEELTQRLNALGKLLGEYPHGSLTSKMTNNEKKQGTRMLKVVCPDCDYAVRTTAKWLEVGVPVCPCGTEMRAEEKE